MNNIGGDVANAGLEHASAVGKAHGQYYSMQSRSDPISPSELALSESLYGRFIDLFVERVRQQSLYGHDDATVRPVLEKLRSVWAAKVRERTGITVPDSGKATPTPSAGGEVGFGWPTRRRRHSAWKHSAWNDSHGQGDALGAGGVGLLDTRAASPPHARLHARRRWESGGKIQRGYRKKPPAGSLREELTGVRW